MKWVLTLLVSASALSLDQANAGCSPSQIQARGNSKILNIRLGGGTEGDQYIADDDGLVAATLALAYCYGETRVQSLRAPEEVNQCISGKMGGSQEAADDLLRNLFPYDGKTLDAKEKGYADMVQNLCGYNLKQAYEAASQPSAPLKCAAKTKEIVKKATERYGAEYKEWMKPEWPQSLGIDSKVADDFRAASRVRLAMMRKFTEILEAGGPRGEFNELLNSFTAVVYAEGNSSESFRVSESEADLDAGGGTYYTIGNIMAGFASGTLPGGYGSRCGEGVTEEIIAGLNEGIKTWNTNPHESSGTANDANDGVHSVK